MPARETRPNVGLIPTSEHAAAGQTIEPSVSVPTPTAAKFAAIAAAVPELEPHGLRSSTYGFFHWPPRALHPQDELFDRKLAPPETSAFTSMTAPAAPSASGASGSAKGGLAGRAKPRAGPTGPAVRHAAPAMQASPAPAPSSRNSRRVIRSVTGHMPRLEGKSAAVTAGGSNRRDQTARTGPGISRTLPP